MYEISKEFRFEAAHQLVGLPVGHKCGRVHGHRYVVTLVLRSDVLNEHGFVVDFGDLAPFADMLDAMFDHRFLNDAVSFPTTAEHLARYFHDWARLVWPETVSVTVAETDRCTATWRP